MNIVLVGSGYVGLVTGVCFAEFGFNVTCVDNDEKKIQNLKSGVIPIFEPRLQEQVIIHQENECLNFTNDIGCVKDADVVFIAVGTPQDKKTGEADTRYVMQAVKDLAPHLQNYTVVVTKSTVPVGTTRKVKQLLAQISPTSAEVDVVSNPEFLREGSAIDDFMRPDRVVIGVETDKSRDIMRKVYRPLYLQETPIVECNYETAELAKYAANAFLATKVAFINEMSSIAENCGANVKQIAKSMGLDKRIGPKFLHPGPGYGGSCFPKDTLALVDIAKKNNSRTMIVESVVESNNERKHKMAEKIDAKIDCHDYEKVNTTIAILGVTFKPNTDDLRDSPSLVIIPELVKMGYKIRAYDPMWKKIQLNLLPSEINWCKDAYDAATGASAVVILTEWNKFRGLDFNKMAEVMQRNLLIDLRNIYNKQELSECEFEYEGVGV